MKARTETVIRAGFATGVLLVVSFVPLVPVEQAPVVPGPIYHSTWASLQDLVGIGIFRLGVNNRAVWATLPVMVGLVAASLLVGWWLGGLMVRAWCSSRQPTLNTPNS